MNGLPQDRFDQVVGMTELYLRDEISDDQLAELEDLVRENQDAAAAMRTVLKQAGMMRVVFAEQQQFASRVGEADRGEYLALLQTLSPIEEPEPVKLLGTIKVQPPLWQQWQFVIPSAIAAALAIAVTLIIVLTGNTGAPDSAPLTNNSSEPDRVDPEDIRAVATLTAEHDAVWSTDSAEGALAPGSDLRPGQRFTLIQGFAEITTNRGAIAVIEAPATIELIDSNNALRLHAGKLVGICETESSKGFTVKTEHADIIDIGTEFGVEVVADESTRVHVFRGEVRAQVIGQNNPQSGPTVFAAGQAADISKSRGIQAVSFDSMRFGFRRGYYLTGQIETVRQAGLSLVPGDTESNDAMLFIPEREGLVLQQQLHVVLPGDQVAITPQARTLTANTRVDSYLIHFDAANDLDGPESITLKGEVRFDRPILGVILDSTRLHQSTATIGSSQIRYSPPEALVGLEDWGDRVTLSQDGQTLRITLSAKHGSHQGIDQIRVLVAAEGSRHNNESDETTQ